MSSRWVLLCLLLAWVTHSCLAQPLNSFVSLRFDESNGLTAPDVYGVAQDNDGYIWIGTNEGLFKFDGTSFDRYGSEDGITSLIVTRVYAFADGDVVAIGEDPVTGYLIRQNHIYPFGRGNQTLNSGLLTWADSDTLWSNCGRCGSVVAIVDTQVVDSIALPAHEPHGRILEGLKKHNGTLYGIPDGPGFKIRKHGTFKRQRIPAYPNESLLLISEDQQGNGWALGSKHVFVQTDSSDWEVHAEHQLSQDGQRILHHAWDWAGRMWLAGMHKGLYIYDPQTRVLNQVDDALDIDNLQVTHLFSDREQNVWISTAGSGLLYVRKGAFENYGLQSGLASEYILRTSIRRDGGLLVSTNAGISRSVREEGNRRFTSNPQEDFYALDLMDDGSVDLFCTTSHKSGLGYHGRFSLSGEGWQLFWGRRFGPYSKDTMWVGNWMNAFRFVRGEDGKWGEIPEQRFKIDGKCRDWAQWRGGWYLLTNHGLHRFQGDTFQKIQLPIDEQGRIEFMAVEADEDGLWIPTTQGLFHWSPDSTYRFGVENGMASDQCYSVALDSSGTVWVGTTKGLCAFVDGRFRIFQRGTGLPSNQIHSVCYDSARHELWIATSSGLSRLAIGQTKVTEELSPPLYVKALEVIGDTMIRGQHVNLEETQNHLRLHFAAVHYVSPEEIHYQYRLFGLQGEWTETKTNVAEYLALAPGNYDFQVRSRTAGSDWGPVASMSFNIQPPIWMRWYVLLGALSVLALLTVAFSRWNVRRVRRQELQKRKTLSTINRLEQQALQANMNPHFVFNTLNSIQHILAKHKDPVAMDFVADFATLVRQNMEAASKKSITLKQEIERLERYLGLEAQRLEGKLKFRVTASDDLTQVFEEVQIPSMLIQPFVENAIWHGIAPKEAGGTIQVSFQQVAQDVLQVIIEDDGVGMSASPKKQQRRHISRGVELTRQRLKMASERNKLQIEELRHSDGTARGTRVTLIVDLH